MQNRPLIKQNIKSCFQNGLIDKKEYMDSMQETDFAFKRIEQKAKNGHFPFLEVPFATDDLESMRKISDEFQKFKTVLIFGTGGSALGGKALCSLMQSWVMAESAFPRIYFMENLDAETFWEIMSVIDPKTIGIISISKSGKTPETLIQTMRCIEYLSEILDKESLAERIIIITEDKDNPLRKIADHFNIRCMNHPDNIGGRFSCFSIVSLIPAMIVGFDALKFRKGAALTCNQIFFGHMKSTKEAVAAMLALYKAKKIKTHVMFPYGDVFSSLVFWHRQLWAESLGKNGCGFTPVYGMGPVDQHSQLQLYLDGPKDKFFTIMIEMQVAREKLSPGIWSFLPEAKELACNAIADLVSAQCKATCQCLFRQKQAFRVIEVPSLNEEAMGALMMNFIIETLVMSEVLRIDPLTQPMVEEGKKIAMNLLR